MHSIAAIAARIGRSQTYVRRLLRDYPQHFPSFIATAPKKRRRREIDDAILDRIAYDDYHGLDPTDATPTPLIDAQLWQIPLAS